MPTMRETLMESAFPEIRKQLSQTANQGTPWRALFKALGTRPVSDTTRRVRIINVQRRPLQVPKRPPDSATRTVTITKTTAEVVPHVRVRTIQKLSDNDLDRLRTSDAMVDPTVQGWADLAFRTGNLVLFTRLKERLDTKDLKDSTVEGLSAKIHEARKVLSAQAMNLLVKEDMYGLLTRDREMRKQLEHALRGGAVVPVMGLEERQAYLLRGEAGDVTVEIIQELQPYWDISDAASVLLIAQEEFVLVAEKPIPACQFTLE